MHINGAYYHPTFLYESLWSLLGVALLLVLRNQKQLLLRGETTASYLIWYGFGRLLIEGLRTDSLYLGSFRISQGVSAVIILIGIGIILYQRRYAYPKPKYYTDGMQYELEFERKKEAYKLATQRK